MADKLTAICEPIVEKMWEPRRPVRGIVLPFYLLASLVGVLYLEDGSSIVLRNVGNNLPYYLECRPMFPVKEGRAVLRKVGNHMQRYVVDKAQHHNMNCRHIANLRSLVTSSWFYTGSAVYYLSDRIRYRYDRG
jgi:hypothetical protein